MTIIYGTTYAQRARRYEGNAEEVALLGSQILPARFMKKITLVINEFGDQMSSNIYEMLCKFKNKQKKIINKYCCPKCSGKLFPCGVEEHKEDKAVPFYMDVCCKSCSKDDYGQYESWTIDQLEKENNQ